MQKIAKIRWASISVLAVVSLLFASLSILLMPKTALAANKATWISKTEILLGSTTYKSAGTGQVFGSDDTTQYQLFTGGDVICPSTIYFPKTANLDKVKEAKFNPQTNVGSALSGVPGGVSCVDGAVSAVSFTNTRKNPNANATPAADTQTVAAEEEATVDPADSETNQDLCDTSVFNPLTWVLCPTVDLIHKGTDVMQKMINHLMLVDATGIFDRSTSSGQSYYTAWNSFRVFGIALLLIAGLVMVVSQALGFEIIDAYTVKRILPRLIVAVIGISLSWWLMWFLVNLTNDLGVGIRRLIYTPFQGLISQTGDTGLSNLGSTLIGNLAIGGALVFLQWGGILSLLATVGLAVLIAFVVLILRQVVITFLILLAPLAIACYVLPNTEKAYKLWWDSLSKGLMMFPIISAFIAAGAVFSVVASSNQSSDFGLSSVIATLAYFLPYFALPFTFRLAGGAIATLGGLANDRGRGAFDRLKNYRAGKVAYNTKRLQNNQRWDPSSKLGRRANTVGSWVTDPGSNFKYAARNVPGFKKGGQRIAGQIEHARVEQSAKLFEELNKAGFNDVAFRSLSGAMVGDDGRSKYSEDVTRQLVQNKFLERKEDGTYKVGRTASSLNDVQTLGNIFATAQGAKETERIAGNALRASAGRLATLYQDEDMGKASLQAAGIMGLSAHGFADGHDIASVGNTLSHKKPEEAGFAQAVMTQSQLMGMRSRPDVKPGYGVVSVTETDENGNEIVRFVDGMSPEGGRAEQLLDTLSSQDLAAAKGGSIKKLEPIIKAVLARGDAKSQAQKDQLFQWASPYSTASVDVKAKALEMIRDFGLQEEFDRKNRALSAEEIAAMQARGEDPSQQQDQGNNQQ